MSVHKTTVSTGDKAGRLALMLGLVDNGKRGDSFVGETMK